MKEDNSSNEDIIDFKKLSDQIESFTFYHFLVRHKKIINIIEGVFVIILLIGLNSYLYKDRQLKEQIADHCGFTTNEYICQCSPNLVETPNDIGEIISGLNLTSNSDENG